jgi:hypothetical protein
MQISCGRRSNGLRRSGQLIVYARAIARMSAAALHECTYFEERTHANVSVISLPFTEEDQAPVVGLGRSRLRMPRRCRPSTSPSTVCMRCSSTCSVQTGEAWSGRHSSSNTSSSTDPVGLLKSDVCERTLRKRVKQRNEEVWCKGRIGACCWTWLVGNEDAQTPTLTMATMTG